MRWPLWILAMSVAWLLLTVLAVLMLPNPNAKTNADLGGVEPSMEPPLVTFPEGVAEQVDADGLDKPISTLAGEIAELQNQWLPPGGPVTIADDWDAQFNNLNESIRNAEAQWQKASSNQRTER